MVWLPAPFHDVSTLFQINIGRSDFMGTLKREKFLIMVQKIDHISVAGYSHLLVEDMPFVVGIKYLCRRLLM